MFVFKENEYDISVINDRYHSLPIILLILNRTRIFGMRFNGSEIFLNPSCSKEWDGNRQKINLGCAWIKVSLVITIPLKVPKKV
jgi:hypothetical protein